eukprot:14706551-Alexandrium_andersonii.AAC.1
MKDEARSHFWPAQVGVACPLGCKAAAHAAQHWFCQSEGAREKVTLKVDFANAFNTGDRSAALSA